MWSGYKCSEEGRAEAEIKEVEVEAKAVTEPKNKAITKPKTTKKGSKK